VASDNKTSLMALGSAAVLGVYAAGWFKTKAAADLFAAEGSERRRPAPTPMEAAREGTVQRVEPARPGVKPGTTQPVLRAGAAAAVPTLPPMTRAAAAKIALPKAADDPPPLAPTGSLSRYVIAPSAPVVAAKDSVAAAPPTTVTSTSSAPAVPLPQAPVAMPAPPPVAPPASVPKPAPTPTPVKQAEPPAHPAEEAGPKWKDGTYYGWGTSRHGDIQAAVVIKDGRIANALIAQCLTQYSCSWIVALPPQVVGRQSAEVDYVSGATQSTNAFYYAVMQALTRAK